MLGFCLRRPGLSEFLLLLAVLLMLFHLAAPLANLDMLSGRGQRYLMFYPDVRGLSNVRAMFLAAHAAPLLAMLALTGQMVLWLGRCQLPLPAIALIGGAIWSAAAAGLFRYDPATAHVLTSQLLFTVAAVALLLTPLAARWSRSNWQAPQRPARVWLYPLFVGLTGVGLLVLVDYSARAAEAHQYVALGHAWALMASYMVLTLGAGLKPSVIHVLARLLARLDGLPPPATARSPAHGWRWLYSQPDLRGFILALLLLAWVGLVFFVVGRDWRQTGLRAELIRLPFYALLGWLAYRWLDTQNGVAWSWRRGFGSTVLVLLAVFLPLRLSRDNGQMLLLMLAGAVLVGALAGAWLARLARWVAFCISAVGVSAVMWALYTWGPDISETVKWRVEALLQPFASHYEYLSELRWLMANTPTGGWGLTQVPWCGTLGQLSAGTCPAVPFESHTDHMLAALFAVWGAPAACVLLAATALYLLALVRTNSFAQPRLALHPQPQRLAVWMLLVFVAISLVQLYVTALGSVGLMPMTGVVFPLMGYGKTALLVTAAYSALAMNEPTSPATLTTIPLTPGQ